MDSKRLCGVASLTEITNTARGAIEYTQYLQKTFMVHLTLHHGQISCTFKDNKSGYHPQMLSQIKFVLAKTDNTQQSFNVKNHRGGVNNNFIKVLEITFVECDKTVINGVEYAYVLITYTDQVVPHFPNKPQCKHIAR